MTIPAGEIRYIDVKELIQLTPQLLFEEAWVLIKDDNTPASVKADLIKWLGQYSSYFQRGEL